jgi:DNA-binding transcriptional LysR family regulator
MDTSVLRNFLAILEAGSIRRAADNLHIAQSALTRQIAALEREAGTPLLMRLARGIRPTEAGLIAARHARAALEQLDRGANEIRALNGMEAGRIAVATIEPLAATMLPACITRLHAQHPGISFDVRVGNTRQVLSLLAEGVVDFALAYNAPLDPRFAVRAEARMPLVAMVRNGHSLAAQAQVTLKELAEWPLILPPTGSPSRVLIDEAARRESCHFGTILIESDSAVLRLGVVDGTDAVAVLAETTGHMPGRGRDLHVLAIRHPIMEHGSLQLLSNAGLGMSRASLIFERLLRAEMRMLRRSDRVAGEQA